jgi:hypothetical protein
MGQWADTSICYEIGRGFHGELEHDRPECGADVERGDGFVYARI